MEKETKFRLTQEERNWVLYDVGNSAFILLVATILPIYFNHLATQGGLSDVEYLAYWGYAASFVTLLIALMGPALGSLADTRGFKKPVFLGAIILGVLGCVCMGTASHWLAFLVIFVIARVGFSASIIFYDSMLSDVTKKERMDVVSSHGYAWGYIGSCIPFVLCLGLVLGSGAIGISMETAMALSLAIVALWWFCMSLPLLKTYRQRYYVDKPARVVRDSFVRLGRTLRHAGREKKVFMFLLAFFFYIDGVYTIIDMATAYGAALGLDSTGLLAALLVTQIVAFPCAIFFGRASRKYSVENLITLCVAAYFAIAVFAMFLATQLQFWILAVLVGMFQGGVQALSRSYYTKIIPPSQSGEFFGLLDIFGKGAAFFGTAIVSVVSQITGDINKGVGMIAVLFAVGIVLFRIAIRMPGRDAVEEIQP